MILLFQTCEIVNVEPPDIDVSTGYHPEYIVKGQIINSTSNGGIELAEIFINNVVILSDEDGYYEYKSNELLSSGSLVEVIVEGYIISNATIIYGEDAPVIYYLDFYLTPEVSSDNINLITGGNITFGNINVSVPGNNFAILDSDSVYSIDMGITPLNNRSTLGNQTGATVKTFGCNPIGVYFEKPVVFRIDVSPELSFSQLSLYRYNDSIDIWVEMSDLVSFDTDSNQIVFSLRSFPYAIKVADPAMITIFSDGIFSESPAQNEPNSCDCEGAFLWSGGYYIRQLTITGTGVLNELNSMHFFSDNNMPYYSALISPGILEAPVVVNLSIPECKIVYVDISRWYREITGTYVYVNELKTFNVRYYFGVSVSTSLGSCPTTSNCHQGCI